jgi:hypothetical protein
MGVQIISLHQATMMKWSIPAWGTKRDAQGKGVSFLGFYFTDLKVFVGRPSYKIDSRTIKRGFRLGNLITSS